LDIGDVDLFEKVLFPADLRTQESGHDGEHTPGRTQVTAQVLSRGPPINRHVCFKPWVKYVQCQECTVVDLLNLSGSDAFTSSTVVAGLKVPTPRSVPEARALFFVPT
jgi:hypothetical protein